MNDHIPDPTKMINDTPRTDAHNWHDGDYDDPLHAFYDFARQLERELNAANVEIERLKKSNLQLREGAEEQKQRIKRLEEAGDFLSHYLREMPYASDYLAQVDERILRISNWRRAKEDNL